MTEVKEWVRFSRGHNGQTVVTVTLQEGNLTAKWSTRAFGKIRDGVKEARSQASRALTELREAVA